MAKSHKTSMEQAEIIDTFGTYHSWRNFATTLKHQRRGFSVEDFIGHLSVEQNSRAKDSHHKGLRELLLPTWCNRRTFRISSRERTRSNRILPSRRRERRTRRMMAALLVVH